VAPQLKKLCTSCSRDAVEPALRASAIDIGEIARGAGSYSVSIETCAGSVDYCV
jgi:hypothetical protein